MRRRRFFGAGLVAMLMLGGTFSAVARADHFRLSLRYPHKGAQVPQGAVVEGRYGFKVAGNVCQSSGSMTMGFQTGRRSTAEDGTLPVPSCEAEGGGAPSGLQVQGGYATELVLTNRESPQSVLEFSVPLKLELSAPHPACVYESKTKIKGTAETTKVMGYKEVLFLGEARLRRKPPSPKTCASSDTVHFEATLLSGGEPLEAFYEVA